MTGTDGRKPAAVPNHSGKRAGEAGPARPAAEPSIWTARMLATLETGVMGGKWYSLIDKLYPETTLRAAFKAVAGNRGAAGVDHVSIEDYAENLDASPRVKRPRAGLARLSEALRTGSYRPQAIRRHYIPKQGSQEKRPLRIPTVQDRVVQRALRMVIESVVKDWTASAGHPAPDQDPAGGRQYGWI
jgi:RNA-directed DNA polymerase